MNIPDILREHLRRSGSDVPPDKFIDRVAANVKAGAQLVREGDCVFLFAPKEKGTVALRIFNADSQLGYAKAVRAFVGLMRKAGAKKLQMNVADKQSAQGVARMAGVKQTSFTPNKTDQINPQTMTMEL
jgi:hypothetical protein